MTAITTDYLAEVRGQHKEALTVPGMCQMCFTMMPCHALVLADAVEALQAKSVDKPAQVTAVWELAPRSGRPDNGTLWFSSLALAARWHEEKWGCDFGLDLDYAEGACEADHWVTPHTLDVEVPDEWRAEEE